VQTTSAPSQRLPKVAELSKVLGVPIEVAPGETNQYLIKAPRGSADLSKLGKVDQDFGYALGVTLNDGTQIGFRYLQPSATSITTVPAVPPSVPTAEELSRLLGMRVDKARGETNQYLIRAKPGSVELSKLGTIHQDLGYAVGVTLKSGVQIGFRYTAISESKKTEPVPQPVPTMEELSRVLGVPVDEAPGEINQYLIRAPVGSVDLTPVGTIHQDLGYAVGVTLKNGVQIGFRYEPAGEPGPK
jgi:hypothetical protein